MRWPVKVRDWPKHGDDYCVQRFALWPTKVGAVWVWLEPYIEEGLWLNPFGLRDIDFLLRRTMICRRLPEQVGKLASLHDSDRPG